ncbi:hypothetical protein EYZ11_007948 [Aspergillus tanneri]|uniref:Uncharacterized protein n=1 Tax=Aspergillus tanneri TaxID=1220188 RepID=A0A4S3JC39_9EURO|nr:hypothetical protein EYZ11_007948 [Aspergillus tanneri]
MEKIYDAFLTVNILSGTVSTCQQRHNPKTLTMGIIGAASEVVFNKHVRSKWAEKLEKSKTLVAETNDCTRFLQCDVSDWRDREGAVTFSEKGLEMFQTCLLRILDQTPYEAFCLILY